MAGCAKRPPHISHGEIGRATKRAGVIEANLRRLEDATHTIKALVRLEISNGGEFRSMDAALVVVRPDRIRIDAMDALADVWASAGSDGNKVWLYLPAKKRLYTGRMVRKNLNRLVNFNLEVPELISLLTGVPPLGKHIRVLQLGKRNNNHFVTRGGEIHLWTRSFRSDLISKCVRYGDGGNYIDYEVEFYDYRSEGEAMFPHRIEVTVPKRKIRAVIEYVEMTTGGDVDPQVFRPAKGRHRRTVDLERYK